jgi:hypothetical protein
MLPDLNRKQPQQPKTETDFGSLAKKAMGRGYLTLMQRGPVPGANRRVRQAAAQKQSAAIVTRMKDGFGHPAFNPIARFVPKS